MAQLAVALNLGQSVGTPGGPDYVTTPAAAPLTSNISTVVTDTAAVSTDLTTAFTALDAFGNALVAITGDTYSSVTHQWTTGGSTGLTHAQVVTLMALFNTASTDFITAQTDATTAHSAAVAANSGITGADAILIFDTTKFTLKNQVLIVGRRLLDQAVQFFSF